MVRLPRGSSSPARLPAMEKDWQGVPPARRSIAPTSAAPIFVKSPKFGTLPNRGRATILRMAAARCFASLRVVASCGLGMCMGRDAPWRERSSHAQKGSISGNIAGCHPNGCHATEAASIPEHTERYLICPSLASACACVDGAYRAQRGYVPSWYCGHRALCRHSAPAQDHRHGPPTAAGCATRFQASDE